MNEVQKYKYKAFISYSHKDEKWGRWLHRNIEGYRIPKGLVGRETLNGTVPRRIFPLFRDREELPTASDLNEIINQALIDSSHLIVICSPNSVKSKWVNEEVKAFKKQGKQNRILCLIVDGEPNADSKPEMGLKECFPPAVKVIADEDGNLTNIQAEPIAADARLGKDGKSNAKLKLVAGLLGVGFDELNQRELKHKKQRLSLIASCSFLLALIMMMFSYNALKLKGEADLSFDSSINQYNFLSSIFVSSLKDADLEEFENGDIDLMIHLLIESSERLTNEEAKLIENKLYGKDLLYRLNLHSTLGASFEALEYNEDAIYHYEQAIKILRESKKRKIVKYQWGIIPIREPKLPSWESEIKVYEKKIELLKNFVVRNGKPDRRKSNYHFVQYTKEGFDALRDDKISGLHKKGMALSLELELLSKNCISNKKINIKEFEDIRERALDLYPSKAIQLFWTKKFKRMAESRMNHWMSHYYNTIGFTYLNVAIDIKGQKKLFLIKKAKENFEQAIKLTAMIDYETIFQDIDEVSKINKEKETYLMLIETVIELTSVIENKFKGNENSIEQIERKILNKGSVIYSNGGIENYGSWINFVLVLAKIKEDLDLFEFSFKKSLQFNLKNARSNADDIKLSIGRLMLLSIMRQDVSEIEDVIIEIKKLNKFDDSDLKNLSQNADAIFGKITNNINNSILFIKRQSQTKIEYIEENKPLYKIVSNFDDDGFLFNSTNFISNKVIFSDSGINENLIDVFKSIDNAENNVLLENNLNNKILTMKYNIFEIGFEGFSISIGVNLLGELMENSVNAKVVVNSLESSDLLEFSSDNNPLKYAVVYGYEDLVQELIDKGSDLSNKCALGNTILHYAVFGKNINIVDKFIRAGVDINAKNNNGMSALYITVFNLQKEIVKILIDNGANVNEITNEGSLLDAVEKFSKSKEISKSRDRRKNIRDIIKFLKRAGAKSANKKADGKIFKPKINSNLISI